ncbi:cysteine-hydrolase super family protein [Novosphingobium sp. Rr 2-17]|uniref:cysteine hydrolase family protein n=1 Tax=Novosphingobium sp. Rr 2-17 TaxID=555793 RepID=UPI0002697AE2|nr:isochorismatase family cysteine hydrolase [Novosphingobium sp. Rr 2-17]EIZ81178.1 cysteine-hydrolase super family protein [Novosphingobium sp. Rr 2-17]
MKRFVIVVDMQRDFVAADGALPVPGGQELVAPMQRWLGTLPPDDVAGVLFTADTHVPEIYARSAEATEFPPHCERGTAGWALVVDPAVIDPNIPTYVLEKGVFDMWAEPGLRLRPFASSGSGDRDAFFAQLGADGVKDVTVIGVAADYCVRWAVEGLIARGFRVAVPVDLTRGIARQIDAVAGDEWTGAAVAIIKSSP